MSEKFMTFDIKIKNAILVNEFSEFGVRSFKADFDELRNSNLPIIPIVIDSYGGEIYSLLAMLDIISVSDRPIATISIGKAMSCGSILLACGTKGFRFVGPHSTVMIHDAATYSFGKIEDLKSEVGEADRLNNKIFSLLDVKCSKRAGYFKNILAEKKHTNWYLDSEEALKHGLVDHVGIPIIDSMFNLDIVPSKKKPTKGKKTKAVK
jgi:ATP-dependent Clp protease protease subunit